MILIGSRMKGIGLGVMGMLGMLVFVFVFGMRPAEPPLDVMLIILAIVATAATMQAAGGLDYLVGVAENIIRSNPERIVFIAPFTTFFLCLFAGTSHVVYSLLPIIAEVSAKKRIRPERPLSISVVAAHLALTGSPMSAATAALAAILVYNGASIHIMMICIPACLLGVLAGCFAALRMGRELPDDPVFLQKMQEPNFSNWINSGIRQSQREVKPGAKTAVLIFGIAILLVVISGAFPGWLPNLGAGKENFAMRADGSLKMVGIIVMVTLAASAAIMLLTKTSSETVMKATLFTAMAAAVVSVFGVVWMSATFMAHNDATIKASLGSVVNQFPWTFAIAVFLMGILMFSQAATTRAMMPLGIALGLPPVVLIGVFPAVNSDFVLPGYPTLLAAINVDRTGSTSIGRYVFNHSFIRPGMVAIVVAILSAFLLGELFL
ncbi:anaerobic C4-dicarboxylate transporter [Flavihumibacter fluvii]|nr:anaerobic C4-dicarboxylate transporter [Flavihumibacter fluvii]ULQ53066.1 anaerobic C4-dicarboxylate transporter [Flavihumibacter fluvii]